MSTTTQDIPALRGHSPSSRSASISLQAAAAVNAGLLQEDSQRSPSIRSPQSSRRRSSVLMNLALNDPSRPAPGEMVSASNTRTTSPQPLAAPSGSPQHFRNPSLGDIHQELEQEQEAQVNRLLQMIRTQQAQLLALQTAHGLPASAGPASASAIDDSTSQQSATPRSPRPRSSFDLARADLQRRSGASSRNASPRPEGEGWLGGRDEGALHQAEVQMMARENQMLRMRIRELERQVTELNANAAITHEPVTPSNLLAHRSSQDETAETSEAVAGEGRTE